MKTFKILFIAIITLTVFTSCSKQELEDDNIPTLEINVDEILNTGHGESTNTGGHSGQGEVDTYED